MLEAVASLGERQRIHAILTSDAARGRIIPALHLALETDLTPEQAINRLMCIERIETMKGRSNKLRSARDRLEGRMDSIRVQMEEAPPTDLQRLALELEVLGVAIFRLETSIETVCA